jgi:hypothetical protein
MRPIGPHPDVRAGAGSTPPGDLFDHSIVHNGEADPFVAVPVCPVSATLAPPSLAL